jgi:hypothetical protein
MVPPQTRATLPALAATRTMMYVITGRYRFRGGGAPAMQGAVSARPGPGGGEVGHGGGQDKQVADDVGEADPGLHWCWSYRWLVVRGGRSVLAPPVCGRRGTRDRALLCVPSLASVLPARRGSTGHGGAR